MLCAKTLYRLNQPILCSHRHLLNAESGLDLGVANHVVLR